MSISPTLLTFTPADLGLPCKFSEWRVNQWEAAMLAADSGKRFIGLGAPTGFGKSLAVIVAAILNNQRCAILTSTKALQSQYGNEFREMGLCDVRGANSYPCDAAREFGLHPHTACDRGPCHVGANCALKVSGCHYYDAVRSARRARLVVTNYAYWMFMHRAVDRNPDSVGLGKFDMLVLDEAHAAQDHLSDFLHCELDRAEVERLGLRMLLPGCDLTDWRQWATQYAGIVESRLDDVARELKGSERKPMNLLHEAAELKRLQYKVDQIREAEGEWIVAWDGPGNRVEFDPVWPKEYAERCLFRSTPRVVMVSATMRPKTAQLLGVEDEDLNFQEYPSSFPVARRPIYHVPTVRMNHRTSEDQRRWWATRIDQIIGARLDRKGIVHTVSYARAKELMKWSRYGHLMVFNDTRNTQHVVERFKRMPPPAILVSPSVGTGFDFSGTSAEYQVIAKLPWPDIRSDILQARTEHDADWPAYCCAQQLVQMCGRVVRSEEDQGETIIVDDNFGNWFFRKYDKFFPGWFKQAVRYSMVPPKPLPKL